MNYKLINMQIFGDERGKLIPLEANGDIVPFDIKRVYYIYDTAPEQNRGQHAHKELEQIIVAIDGSCQFVLDDGKNREMIWLNTPDRGLYIGKNMWREMRHFSHGCKLMVLASTHYNEKEYIRNYDDFLNLIPNQDIKLENYNLEFLEKSFNWLSDVEIRYFTNGSEFTKEEQYSWYENLNKRNDYKIWGLSYKDEKIGACGLKNITNTSAEYFGYIGEKKYHHMGIGARMLLLTINQAKNLNLKNITLTVIPQNIAAIKLYEKFNFKLVDNKNNLLIYTKEI